MSGEDRDQVVQRIAEQLRERAGNINARHVITPKRRSLWTCEMTNGEQKVLWRGVAAGTMMGLAIGGMMSLVIATKSGLFAGLIQ
jgi:hypothetical protein